MEESHLDGNAMGGLLWESFGVDMTDHRGCCDACGTVSDIAALLAFTDAPGDVMRCPACAAVLMVAVSMPTGLRISVGSLRWFELIPA